MQWQEITYGTKTQGLLFKKGVNFKNFYLNLSYKILAKQNELFQLKEVFGSLKSKIKLLTKETSENATVKKRCLVLDIGPLSI